MYFVRAILRTKTGIDAARWAREGGACQRRWIYQWSHEGKWSALLLISISYSCFLLQKQLRKTKLQISDVMAVVREHCDRQLAQMRQAMCGEGDYRVKADYKERYEVSSYTWNTMSEQQRREHLSKLFYEEGQPYQSAAIDTEVCPKCICSTCNFLFVLYNSFDRLLLQWVLDGLSVEVDLPWFSHELLQMIFTKANRYCENFTTTKGLKLFILIFQVMFE